MVFFVAPHASELLAFTELHSDGPEVREKPILADPAGRLAVGAEVLDECDLRDLHVEIEAHSLPKLGVVAGHDLKRLLFA